MSTAENSEQSLAENLPEEFEVKHGEITGREVFRVRGVEMAWMPSRAAWRKPATVISPKGVDGMLKRSTFHREEKQAREKPQKRIDLDATTKRMLRRIERMQRAAAAGADVLTTEWETEFMVDVGLRLQTFGRAFADPEKGDLSRPVSFRQAVKLGEIQRSLRRKSGKQARNKTPTG